MIVIKYGGSILSPGPTGKYSKEAVEKIIQIIADNEQKEFCLIIGGGKLCRFIQDSAEEHLKTAGVPDSQMGFARDELGIAVTKINARYLHGKLVEAFEDQVCPELLIDPHKKPKPGYRVYVATGAAPGSSTDYDTILLAETFGASHAIKISDFPVVLDVKALEFDKEKISEYTPVPKMNWDRMLELVGSKWVAGGNYPLDPAAAVLGARMALDNVEEEGFTLLIGQYAELEKMIAGKEFVGTTVKNLQS